MKNLLVKSIVGLLMAVTAASAATVLCADQTNDATGTGGATLDKYVALGAAGCKIGNVLFSNFAYSYILGTDASYVSGLKGTGTQQDSTNVGVTVDELNQRLEFGAYWIVNHYQTATLSLSFTVTAGVGNPLHILNNAFTAFQGGTQNGGPVSNSAATCTGGTCGSPTNFTNTTVNVADTTGPLSISDTVTMNANGNASVSTNNYHLSVIEDRFAETAPSTTPEPMTYTFTSAGIGLLALLRRRKQT